MSLDDVAKKVTEKGKLESSKIIKEGEKEAILVVNKALKEAKAIMAEAMEKAEKQIGLMKEQEMSSAEVDGRRNMLKAEKEVLDAVKAKTFQSLRSAPRDKKEQIISGLVKQAGTVISSGFIYSNQEDADYVKRMVGNYQFAGTIQCSGGIIVENSDKTQRLNMTYETLLDDLWQEKIGEVAEILFK